MPPGLKRQPKGRVHINCLDSICAVSREDEGPCRTLPARRKIRPGFAFGAAYLAEYRFNNRFVRPLQLRDLFRVVSDLTHCGRNLLQVGDRIGKQNRVV